MTVLVSLISVLAYAAGVSPPRLFFGRSSLYSRRLVSEDRPRQVMILAQHLVPPHRQRLEVERICSGFAPNPPYPDSARKSRTSGTVLVELTIGADGLVKSARVVRSLTEDLDNAALAAVKVWRFEPALKNGQAIATTATVVVSFNLR